MSKLRLVAMAEALGITTCWFLGGGSLAGPAVSDERTRAALRQARADGSLARLLTAHDIAAWADLESGAPMNADRPPTQWRLLEYKRDVSPMYEVLAIRLDRVRVEGA